MIAIVAAFYFPLSPGWIIRIFYFSRVVGADKYLNVASSDVIIGTIIAYVSLQESVRLYPSFKE